jgi:hypothetical protein
MLENERELSAAQRDSDAGALKTLRMQLETSKTALENKRTKERIEQDTRCQALLEQIHEVERQRNDLVSEKHAWRAEKEAMVEHLMVQIESIRKERDAYKNECIRLSAELSDVDVIPMKSKDSNTTRIRDGLPDTAAGSINIERVSSAPALRMPSSVRSQNPLESSSIPSVLNSFSVSSDRFMGVIKKMTQPKRNDDGASIRSDLDSSSSTQNTGAPQTKIDGFSPPKIDSFHSAEADKTVKSNAALPAMDVSCVQSSEMPSPSNSDEEDDAIAEALSKAINLVQEVRRSDTAAVVSTANKR